MNLQDRIETALKQQGITRHSQRYMAANLLVSKLLIRKKITAEEEKKARKIAEEWVK